MFLLLLAIVLSVVVNATATFTEVYPPVCVKHHNREYTSYGLNVRLDADGSFMNNTGTRSANRLAPRTMEECKTMCGENPHCVAFAFRGGEASICQMMTHCTVNDGLDIDMDFKMFHKDTFACNRGVTVPVIGKTCTGEPAKFLPGYVSVVECLEQKLILNGTHFAIDGDLNCVVWDTCGPIIDLPNVTMYLT